MRSLFKVYCLLSLLVLSGVAAPSVAAQKIALKTNALEWLTTSPNIAVEARISQRMTIQLGVSGCPFDKYFGDLSLKNYRVDPEIRYWFNRPMARHFIALSATATAFTLRHKDRHFKGDAVGIGVSYGYALVLNDHWNMEVEAGVGLAHVNAFDYHGDVQPLHKNYSKYLPVPIRLGLSFSYIFK